MNSDIVARLHESFSGLSKTPSDELVPSLHEKFESLFRRDLTMQEEQMLRSYRRLSSDKRDALLRLVG